MAGTSRNLKQGFENVAETNSASCTLKLAKMENILNIDDTREASIWLKNNAPQKGTVNACPLTWNLGETTRENTLKETRSSTFNFLPVVLTLQTERMKNTNKKILETMEAVDQLEIQILENDNILQAEKNDRSKVQENMSRNSHKNDGGCNEHGELFLKLCTEENLKICAKNFKKNNNLPSENEDKFYRCKSVPSNTKNFILRNIELAASAMSKYSLTDDEKHQLEKILSDIEVGKSGSDSKDSLQLLADGDSNITEHNAFVLNAYDKKRINEIDFQLENYYGETEHLRAANTNVADNFWKKLILEQMLKNIDEKLVNIREGDVVK